MVIFVVDLISVSADEDKRYAPIAAHFDRPRSVTIAMQWVQRQAGQIHIARRSANVETAQNQSKPLFVLRLNPGHASGFEKASKPLVPKAQDRRAGYCNPTGYVRQA